MDLKELARRGAAVRLTELREEIAAIQRAFPGLRAAATSSNGAAAPVRRRRKQKPMSGAQKAAVSKRMKAYWAKRRKSDD